jgi:heme A synthase
MDEHRPRTSPALRGWSAFAVGWALLLLFAGANVTTTRSGDAIPSWPQPWLPRDFSTPALIEWSHRGIAAWMGVFTLVLAVWTQRRDGRPAVRRFAWFAVGLVVVQALVGGLRVRFVSDGLDASPTWLKVIHALTGQAFFCCLAALATVLSPSWRDARPRPLDAGGMSVIRLSALGVVLLFVQAMLGALARHGVAPREVHALFALPALAIVARLVLVGGWDVPQDAQEIRRPSALLGVLAAAQLALGLVTYFVAASGVAPEKRDAAQVVLMNLHLAVGAAMLGTTLSILMRAVRAFGLPTDERVAAGSAS